MYRACTPTSWAVTVTHLVHPCRHTVCTEHVLPHPGLSLSLTWYILAVILYVQSMYSYILGCHCHSPGTSLPSYCMYRACTPTSWAVTVTHLVHPCRHTV